MGSSLVWEYNIKVEVNASGKHSSLYDKNYGSKMFNTINPWSQQW
jgi:hypothetical protein